MNRPLLFLPLLGALAAGALSLPARAWDAEGHRIVNQLALASLPSDFPAFVRTPANAERIAFLAPEPDRWSHALDLPLKHDNWMDHYCDFEQIPAAGLDLEHLPSFRYEFAAEFAAGRAAHPENFPPIDPAKNLDHTREWPGFLPWTITEYYDRLKAAFSSLKVYREAGTADEVANAEADVVYLMGVMGHYVGDGAQPLHLTVQHNGWVGPDPGGYTTWTGFHSWIDGGFIAKAHIQTADALGRITPARPLSLAPPADGRDAVFVAVMDYLLEGSKLVVPLYELEKAGKLNDEQEKSGKFGQDHGPVNPEARAFILQQLGKGGQMLGALWLTAWRSAPPDSFLRSQLLRRQAAAAKTP